MYAKNVRLRTFVGIRSGTITRRALMQALVNICYLFIISIFRTARRWVKRHSLLAGNNGALW